MNSRHAEAAVGTLPQTTSYAIRSSPSEAEAQIRVLGAICHAFGSATDVPEALSSTARWVRAALDSETASLSVSLPDRSGRLRTAIAHDLPEAKRNSSRRRRTAFDSKKRKRLAVQQPPGHELAILPLVSRGEALGVLEVVAPRRVLEMRWEILNAVASQMAIVLRNARERSRLERELAAVLETMTLNRELMATTRPEMAVRAAAKFCFERFRLPVAAWLGKEGPARLELVACRGMGRAKRDAVRRALPRLRPWDQLRPSERGRATARFESIIGVEDVDVVNGGEAVLFLAGRPAPSRAFLNALGSVLREVLQHLATVARAEQRNRHLDLGIAWTAHELRAPLLAIRSSLDADMPEAQATGGRGKSQRARHELDEALQQVGELLRWSTGSRPLHRRSTDMVWLVGEAVRSCSLDEDGERISVSAPVSLMIDAEPALLRRAIANLLRNALQYSQADSEVKVGVESEDGLAIVSVSDQGPGVPAANRETIFDPFVRGGGNRRSRSGRGLGLFIARQIVEAHGGRIWLEPGRKGATFMILLPKRGGGGRPGPDS
jgi:K+-sensing histidine kinase KdpD